MYLNIHPPQHAMKKITNVTMLLFTNGKVTNLKLLSFIDGQSLMETSMQGNFK